jgi:Thermopsin
VNPLIDVHAAYSAEPAPMGIADYGIGPNGPYEYSTNSSLGSVSILSLSAQNSSGYPWATFQLNVNLLFTNGNKPYVYWVQDVAQLNTLTNTIYILDNIWNSSANPSAMSGSAISGNGQVAAFGSDFYYYDRSSAFSPGNAVNLAYPAVVEFRVNSSVDASRQPTVTFEYSDGYGWQKYDSVVFTAVHQLTSLSGFVVNGYSYNPSGFYDSELILGGPGGGTQTTDVQSDVRLQLEYWNGHNYQVVTNAYNFGSDTAEGISNAVSQWAYYPSNGELIAQVQSGAGTLGKLWDRSGVSVVDLKSATSSGTLQVRNSSNLSGTPGENSFENGEVTVTLQPGSYRLDVYSGTSLLTSGKYTLTAGQLLNLRTPLGIIPLTVSYSVVGGGSGFSPPTLTYTYNGAVQTALIGTTPVVYDLDSGSAWSVTSQLPGSGATERWGTNQTTAGTAGSVLTESITYYHQYLVSISYSVSGGGSGYSAPALSAVQFGSTASLSVGTSPASYWIDSASAYSLTNPLAGSSYSERWFASGAQGSVAGFGPVTVSYSHQFFLAVTGGVAQSGWLGAGTQVTVSQPIAYGRSGGTGQRVASYSLDSGAEVSVAPALGNVTVPVAMDTAHALAFTSVTQEQVTLDAVAAQALGSITAPTIAGDGYWYDSGSGVTVTLDGTWGRTSGAGDRLVSYSVDGGAQVTVDVGGQVTVLALAVISSPQAVTAISTAQYFLDTTSGSLRSITPTPIGGDSGWYDGQASVTAVYNYVWNASASGSRLNAMAYSVDGGQGSPLARKGSGTFSVTVTMGGRHTIGVAAVAQYLFTHSGGFGVTLSSQSPTGDGFYDADSSTTVTSSYVGEVTSGRQRQALTGYTLDSQQKTVARNDTGTFTTPPIVFDTYHALVFTSVEQYFVTFSFTDSSGSSPIVPSSLTVDEQNGQVSVTGLALWIDNGTSFSVSSLVWEGADVKPVGAAPYSVGAPENLTIKARAYTASVRVTDLLGFAVQGAQVAAKLANGTTVTRPTDSSGVADFGLIPIGGYQATVSSLGISTSIPADASVHSEATATVLLSLPAVGIVTVAAILAVASLLLLRRGRSRKAGSTEP